MLHIFIDFEMTCFEKAERLLQEKVVEIIEIGAVKLNEEFAIIDTFETLVRPIDNQHLSEKCQELTGIEQVEVQEAPILSDAMRKLEEWIGCRDVQFYSWGFKDQPQLFSECHSKMIYKEMPSIYNRWIDFQEIFMKEFDISNKISLTEAINLSKLDFEGKHHGALNDAFNSARLLEKMKDKEKSEQFLKN